MHLYFFLAAQEIVSENLFLIEFAIATLTFLFQVECSPSCLQMSIQSLFQGLVYLASLHRMLAEITWSSCLTETVAKASSYWTPKSNIIPMCYHTINHSREKKSNKSYKLVNSKGEPLRHTCLEYFRVNLAGVSYVLAYLPHAGYSLEVYWGLYTAYLTLLINHLI